MSIPELIENLRGYFNYFVLKTVPLLEAISYNVRNFFDPVPKPLKKETMEEYVYRMSKAQALRFLDYQIIRTHDLVFRSNYVDFREYKGKEKKMMILLVEALKVSHNNLRDLYHETLMRDA